MKISRWQLGALVGLAMAIIIGLWILLLPFTFGRQNDTVDMEDSRPSAPSVTELWQDIAGNWQQFQADFNRAQQQTNQPPASDEPADPDTLQNIFSDIE